MRAGSAMSLPCATWPIVSGLLTQYLSLGDVIAIHDYTMRRLGAAPAVLRDEGALESAIRQPRTAVHYAGTDLIRQAVLLAVGISQAQAFLDGNKPSAFQVMDIFLLLNGMAYDGDPLPSPSGSRLWESDRSSWTR